jgi:multiple sugar transport system permease protein
MTTLTAPDLRAGREIHTAGRPSRRARSRRLLLHLFLSLTAFVWVLPLLWALYASLRPYAETSERGYISLPKALNLDNYTAAWEQAEMPQFFLNTIIITVPAVILTLMLASMVAFVVSRFSFKFNLSLLMLFTAGNLLPQQVIITPLYRMYLMIPLPEWMNENGTLYDSYWGVILINVAFQVGFCTFVLSNYMKTVPHELTEAALVDGASVFRQFWQIIMPLTKPALAALATLEFIWIYNDLFWALVLMGTGSKRPITSGLGNLSGAFFTDYNLLAAGALTAAIPTLIVYVLLQKQFISGLTLGSNKG